MPKSNKLNELLDKGEIKRGKGFTLSTEEEQQESAPVHQSTNAQVQKSTSALVHHNTETGFHGNDGSAQQKCNKRNFFRLKNAMLLHSSCVFE